MIEVNITFIDNIKLANRNHLQILIHNPSDTNFSMKKTSFPQRFDWSFLPMSKDSSKKCSQKVSYNFICFTVDFFHLKFLRHLFQKIEIANFGQLSINLAVFVKLSSI